MIRLKRAYDPPEESDGTRFLVDHFWPRGVRKESLQLESWLKEVSPSAELCHWFNHEVQRWPEFNRRYRAELEQKIPTLQPILEAMQAGDVTLVYSARDEEHNNARALKAYLEEMLAG